MTVYQHRATVSAVAGTTSSTSLTIPGGLLRQVFIAANTLTTIFRANLVDKKNLTVANWGFCKGQINEFQFAMPLQGAYTLNITNASLDDTFSILLSVEE